MKPENLLLGIHKFILSFLFLHYGRNRSTLRAFDFTVGKKLQQKTSQLNAPIPLFMINIMKMVSP